MPRPTKTQLTLTAMVLCYTALFFFYCYRRHMCFSVGDWDLGNYEQSFWTAARLGMPFWNGNEEHSHFSMHNSPIFVLLLPIYALAPSANTLLLLQTTALALGAVPVYLLARDLLGDRNYALAWAALYLLNFPLHGVNYHDFHETGLMVSPYLLSLWGLRTNRAAAAWIGGILGLLGREDSGVLLAGMGGLGLWWAHRHYTPAPLRRTHCYAFIILGLLWTWFSFDVVMPAFGAPVHVHAARLQHLGNGPSQWLTSPLLRPAAFWGTLLRPANFWYFLGYVAPLAFLPLWGLPTLLVAAPILLLNMESQFGGMHLFTSHYAGPIIPFVFAAAIEGQRHHHSVAWLRAAAVLTVLTALLLNPSPLHLGRRVPAIDDHARMLERALADIPADDSVAAPANLWSHLVHRRDAFPFYRDGVEWILVDERYPALTHESNFDRDLPPLLANGTYVLHHQVDTLKVYRRVPAASLQDKKGIP